MVQAAESFRLACREADDIMFRRPNHVVSAAIFLGMAHHLADELPRGKYVVNLCRNRLQFAVALAAAVLRDQVCLLTGDRSPERLRMLAEHYSDLYSLSEEALTPGPLRHHQVRRQADLPLAGGRGNAIIPASRLAAVVLTSGSTGEPIAHRKSWGALAERSADAAARFAMEPACPVSIVGMVPPQHMYGFETTVLMPLHAPASVWCDAAFYPEDVAAALRAVPAPRVLVTTPLQIRALLHASISLPPLARVISATAPLSPDMAAAAERQWNAKVFEIFGATEVGSIASRRTLEGDVWTTYPRVRLSDRAINADESEAMVTGPFAESHGLSDVIEILDDRHFRLLGRRSDMIKLAGRRASLADLTRILTGIEGVLDGQFVAPEDLDRRPTARLMVFAVAPDRSPDDILAVLRDRIDPPFLPRRVILVDELPRNEVGKLTNQTLGALLARVGDA
jgi:acyl-coenzyme A synthetase/AMP-(fatty) acid ligase